MDIPTLSRQLLKLLDKCAKTGLHIFHLMAGKLFKVVQIYVPKLKIVKRFHMMETGASFIN